MNDAKYKELEAKMEALRLTVEKHNRWRKMTEALDELDRDELILVYNKVVQRLLSPE